MIRGLAVNCICHVCFNAKAPMGSLTPSCVNFFNTTKKKDSHKLGDRSNVGPHVSLITWANMRPAAPDSLD
jgi:hypothetical protein